MSDMPKTCYRHSTHRAGVTCQRCDKPICPSCMVSASVGFHCPECAGIRREGTAATASYVPRIRKRRVYSQRYPYRGTSAPGSPDGAHGKRLIVTPLILLANVGFFIYSVLDWGTIIPSSSNIGAGERNYGLYSLFISQEGEWWRIFTSGFVHADIIHIIFNMLFFWMVGQILERTLGSVKFFLVYMSAITGASFGVLWLEAANTLTVGASGAVFGMMGFYAVTVKFSGGRITDSPIVILLALNIIWTFIANNVSIGGHFGGLITGILLGIFYTYIRRSLSKSLADSKILGYAVPVFVGSLLFSGCLLIA